MILLKNIRSRVSLKSNPKIGKLSKILYHGLIRKAAKANIIIDEGIAFTVAYTAMLHAGRALMIFKGYRPDDGYQHKTVVDFASIVLGEHYKTLVRRFDKMRRKRNTFTYEVNISISKEEVNNGLESAENFIKAVRDLIEKGDPQHKFKF